MFNLYFIIILKEMKNKHIEKEKTKSQLALALFKWVLIGNVIMITRLYTYCLSLRLLLLMIPLFMGASALNSTALLSRLFFIRL